MKYPGLGLSTYTIWLVLPHVLGDASKHTCTEVLSVAADSIINHERQEVISHRPNSQFETVQRCSGGEQLAPSKDNTRVACCPPRWSLHGSADTVFLCCSPGHALAGSKETGYECCPEGQVYDGNKCNAPSTVCRPGQTPVEKPRKPPHCPNAGNPSRKPIADCAQRVHPECGDTSYDEANFPCSAGRERPCRGEEVKAWTKGAMYWNWKYQQPGPPQPCVMSVEFDSDVVMSLVDVEAQSSHFLVKLNGEFLGETGGEYGYKNTYTGWYNVPEWCLLNGYSRGYFRIPKGKQTIEIEWPKDKGKYKMENGAYWNYGVFMYRFDKLCNPDKCLPDCVRNIDEDIDENIDPY